MQSDKGVTWIVNQVPCSYVIERYGSLCHLKYLGDMCAIIPFFILLVALSIYECWYNLIFRYSYAIEYVTYRIWLQPGYIELYSWYYLYHVYTSIVHFNMIVKQI